MTRAKKTDLVLDGNEVKLRLTAERLKTKQVVHVDWVRFTCNLRAAPTPSADKLFPAPSRDWVKHWRNQEAHEVRAADERKADMLAVLKTIDDPDFSASAQALQLAEQVCEALGPDFSVYPEIRKGHDFYRFRWSIVRNEVECGWVG